MKPVFQEILTVAMAKLEEGLAQETEKPSGGSGTRTPRWNRGSAPIYPTIRPAVPADLG